MLVWVGDLGMTISNDGGIQLMMDMTGRPSGEAYVKFSSKENAEKALGQDRECIGARCQIFKFKLYFFWSLNILLANYSILVHNYYKIVSILLLKSFHALLAIYFVSRIS